MLFQFVIELNGLKFKSDYNLYTCNCYCRNQRAGPVIIDPGLYHSKKSGVYWAKEKRSVPSSFKLFTGIDINVKLSMNSIVS